MFHWNPASMHRIPEMADRNFCFLINQDFMGWNGLNQRLGVKSPISQCDV